MKYYPIPEYDEFHINTDGDIIDSNGIFMKPFIHNKHYYVKLKDDIIEVAKLVLITFIGIMPASIIYKKGISFYGTDSVEYDINIKSLDTDNMLINNVNFRRLKNYPSYFISQDGVIYSSYKNKLLIRSYNHRNYPTVPLVDKDGYRSPRKVHRLVYETFIGSLDPKLIIDHKNGKKWCCSVWNLEQISQYENVNRAYNLGLNYSRWSNAQINIICQLLERNSSIYEILDKIGLPKDNFRDMTMLIHMILNKKYYTEISKHYDLSNYMSELNKKDRKLSVDDVIDIKQHLHAKDMKIIDIAKKYDCTPSTITKIRDGKTWKHIRYEFNE